MTSNIKPPSNLQLTLNQILIPIGGQISVARKNFKKSFQMHNWKNLTQHQWTGGSGNGESFFPSLTILWMVWGHGKKNRQKNSTHYEKLVRYKVINEGRKGN